MRDRRSDVLLLAGGAVAVALLVGAFSGCEKKKSPTEPEPASTPTPVSDGQLTQLPNPVGANPSPPPTIGIGFPAPPATPEPEPEPGASPSPTPTPTPVPSPTPTPTPTPNCSGTFTFQGTGTPMTLPWAAGQVAPVLISGLPSGCTVKTAKYRLSLSSDVDLSTIASSITILVIDGVAGGTLMAYLIDSFWTQNVPATFSGPVAGTSCGSLVFVLGAPSFTTATPPYDGTFAPGGDVVPGRDVASLNGRTYTIDIFALPPGGTGNITLNCWEMELTLQ